MEEGAAHAWTSELKASHPKHVAVEDNGDDDNSFALKLSSGSPSKKTRDSSTLNTEPVQIPPLSPAAADVVARVNGHGNAESSAKCSIANLGYNNGVRSQPPFVLRVEKNGFDEHKLEANTVTYKSATGTVDSHGPSHSSSTTTSTTPQSSNPSNLSLSEGQVNMDTTHTSGASTSQSTPKQPVLKTENAGTTNPHGTSHGSIDKATPSKRKADTAHGGKNTKRAKRRRSGKKQDADDEGVIKAGDSSSGESSEPTPTTTQTKSGRQINRPSTFASAPAQQSPASPTNQDSQPPKKRRRFYRKGKENNVTCLHCERGHSPSSNVIVFCDECNDAWHQFCHDPPIDKEVVTVKEAQWFCKDCIPAQSLAPERSEDKAKTVRVENKTVQPIQSSTLVGGSRFSQDQRRGYLAGLSHATLVDLLLDVSTSHPELALFPSNLPDLPSSHFAPSPVRVLKLSKAADGPATIDTTLATASGSQAPAAQFASGKATSLLPAATSTAAASSSRNPPVSTGEDGDVFVEHRLYPRPGNGFRLPPDSVDLDMLLEDPACKTFSHSLHGSVGTVAQSRELQAVGSAA